ncbi:MAG: universal stress protein [Rhodospirillales bacterium]
MRTALVPIDGSNAALAAVLAVVRQVRRGEVGAVHLVHVQPPVDGYASRFLGRRAIADWRREEGDRALGDARRMLEDAGVPFAAHVGVGAPAPTVARLADELRADRIVMATGGDGAFGDLRSRLMVGRVIRLASVPVVAVRNDRPTLRGRLAADGLQSRPS